MGENLTAENQCLHVENDYPKICKAWFWKTSGASKKADGVQKISDIH